MLLEKLKIAERKKAKLLRSGLHTRMKCASSEGISSHIKNFLKNRPGVMTVAAYMAIHTEIDLTPAISNLRQLGKTICLPVIVSENQPLIFRVWNNNSRLVEGEFNILVPDSKELLEPDLILCPMLRFDRLGYRLGYGGGFYDRTIAHLKEKKPVFTLGCAYSEQISQEDLPRGKHDKPLDAVATENGVIFFDR